MNEADVRKHNRAAWNRCVDEGNRWTLAVDAATVARARQGDLDVLLTPTRPVPRNWFPPLAGLRVLCLASAGGQQAPLFAAAGADVTSFDNSPGQLEQDRLVAERDGLSLELVEGDMADLSAFDAGSFQLIFHPCSNVFVPSIAPVWRECARVLCAEGLLLAGFTNPVRYLFDDERRENGRLDVRYKLPYSDLVDLDESVLGRLVAEGKPLEFGHTLEEQIGGQLQAGFLLTGFYEDRYADAENDPISRHMSTFIATRASKSCLPGG